MAYEHLAATIESLLVIALVCEEEPQFSEATIYGITHHSSGSDFNRHENRKPLIAFDFINEAFTMFCVITVAGVFSRAGGEYILFHRASQLDHYYLLDGS